MNIIKFKDTVVEGQEWYNKKLRGKYAYWVRCHYVVPLDEITQNMYISFETTINNMLGFDYYYLRSHTETETVETTIYSYTLLDHPTLPQINAAVEVEEIPTLVTLESPEYIYIVTGTESAGTDWQGNPIEMEIKEYYKRTSQTSTKTINVTVYEYELVDERDVAFNLQRTAVLMDSVPEHPTENDPSLIKTCHSNIKYADLWEGDYYWMNRYIDMTETDNVNSIDTLKAYNSHVPDSELTVDDLKHFRTWLAASLLDINYSFYKLELHDGELVYVQWPNPNFDERLDAVEVNEVPEHPADDAPDYIKVKDLNVREWTEQEAHMLTYYRDGMYDDVLKWLDINAASSISIKPISTTSCGCGGNSNISSLYNDTLSVCDPSGAYRSGLKSTMVDLFSRIGTWSGFPSTYLLDIKEYIDGILTAGFSFNVNTKSTIYTCDCVAQAGKMDSAATAILRQLSVVFQYLADGDEAGHKNFITNILTEWSDELYESMEW